MTGRRMILALAVAGLGIAACSPAAGPTTRDAGRIEIPGVDRADDSVATTGGATTAPAPATTAAPPAPGSSAPPPATTTAPPTDSPPATDAPPETDAPTTTAGSTTTTTTMPPLDVYDPNCVVRVAAGDSLGLIADRFDDQTVTAASIAAENAIVDPDVVDVGALLDVCVDNGLDDVTGEQRLEPNEALASAARREVVEAQQVKLNELFAGLGIRPLLVDGISGPVTRQRLCAARVALGLPVTLTDMEGGSLEEVALMFATELPPPPTSALRSDRWVLIDRTCQIVFAGAGADTLQFVFPTSTGEAGHETRDQDRSRAFRYDPALHNGGWHNSTTFPVAIDNPLNGNMYRPIYFDGGQAIHGSNNVPTSPQSKGCARLRVEDQDALVAWLGLDDLAAPTWSASRIGVTVNVQGAYPEG